MIKTSESIFEKAYNFLIGMCIGLFVIYWVTKYGGGCRNDEKELPVTGQFDTGVCDIHNSVYGFYRNSMDMDTDTIILGGCRKPGKKAPNDSVDMTFTDSAYLKEYL